MTRRSCGPRHTLGRSRRDLPPVSRGAASNFRRGRLVEHLELAELFDEGRTAQLEQPRGVSDGPARAIQRLLNQAALYREQVLTKIDAFRRKLSERIGRMTLREQRHHLAVVELERVVLIEVRQLGGHRELLRFFRGIEIELREQRGWPIFWG